MKEGAGISQGTQGHDPQTQTAVWGQARAKKGWGEVAVGKEGDGDRKKPCLGPWAHDAGCRQCFVGLST